MTAPIAILPVLNGSRQVFSGDGLPLVTRIWGAGASLADAGWQLKPKHTKEEVKPMIMTAVERVQAIAKAKNISFDEAVMTPEGRRLYAEYKETIGTEAPGNPTREKGLGDKLSREFAGDGDSLIDLEAEIEAKVDGLLQQEGKHTPTSQDRADATSRLLMSEPRLYEDYVRSHRAAIGR